VGTDARAPRTVAVDGALPHVHVHSPRRGLASASFYTRGANLPLISPHPNVGIHSHASACAAMLRAPSRPPRSDGGRTASSGARPVRTPPRLHRALPASRPRYTAPRLHRALPASRPRYTPPRLHRALPASRPASHRRTAHRSAGGGAPGAPGARGAAFFGGGDGGGGGGGGGFFLGFGGGGVKSESRHGP